MFRLRSPARCWLASLVAMALVGGMVPTVAGAAWTAPVTLSGLNADSPQVAVDPDGDAVFTWVRFDGTNYRIQARARSAAGALSPVQNLSAALQDAFDPQVAVDDAGNAIFTWGRSDGTNSRIQARGRSAGGVLGPVQTLSAAGQNAAFPQVAVDGNGNAIFTWARFDGSNPTFPPCCRLVQTRKRSAGGALGPIQTLSAAGRSAAEPQVAVEGDGDAVFTWDRSDGTNSRIQARRRTAAGALSSIQTLSAAGQNAFEPQVGVDGTGDAVFTWARDDPYSRIQARARSAAGTLSPTQTLSAAGQNSYDSQVGVDGPGNALFTWSRFDGTSPDPPFCCYRVEARRRSAGGALGSILPLSAAGQNAGGSQVAVQGDGDAVFIWSRFDGSSPPPDPDPCCARVQARTRSAAGALGPTSTLSPAGQDGGFAQVAVNDVGDSVATWAFRSDGISFVIQAAAGP
jgi:hypothetical protein